MPYDVLGIGAPNLDHIVKVPADFLTTLPGKKEGMKYIDYEEVWKLIQSTHKPEVSVAGGSACNTLKGLAHLGRHCALIGSIGNDPVAQLIKKNLQDNYVNLLLVETQIPTGHVVCLVDPEGKRTFRTYVGAGRELSAKDLEARHFNDLRLVHIEGYSLHNGAELVETAMHMAKRAGARVSFDLSAFEIVEQHQSIIQHLLDKYIDVLFSNEHEIHALTGREAAEAVRQLSHPGKVIVASIGRQGCWVAGKGQVSCFPAYPKEPVDTTGAGDLFASGFLHGYLSEAPIETCARYGAILGAAVVMEHGAEIPLAKWDAIRKQL